MDLELHHSFSLSVCFSCTPAEVMSAGTMTATFYQAEEDDDITIRWDSPIKTDMSITNMRCFLWSNPSKLLYQMFNSVDVPESQDPQFAGRVQCDKDALRDGQIRLLLSRLRTEDSGNYWCDLAANYDKTTQRWLLSTTEHFVLNVTSHGDNRGHEEHNIITAAPTEGGGLSMRNRKITGVCVGVFLMILLVVGAIYWRTKWKNKNQIKREPVIGALLKGHVSDVSGDENTTSLDLSARIQTSNRHQPQIYTLEGGRREFDLKMNFDPVALKSFDHATSEDSSGFLHLLCEVVKLCELELLLCVHIYQSAHPKQCVDGNQTRLKFK